MNDEEKEAIKYWKTHMKILHCNTQIASEHYIKVLLDLVEKQQNKIEDLKKEKRILIEKYTEVVYECGKRNKEIAELRNIIFKFIPKSNYEVEFRTKIIKLLGE